MQHIEPGARRAIWARYEQWNGALAAVAEEQGAGGKPLYLELDDEVLKAAGRHLGEDILEPKDQLIRLVRATLDIGPHAAPLSTHAQKARSWRPDSGEPPPCLAFLYVCSAAAMEMRTGDGMVSRNYYGRLAEVLQLPKTDLPELTRGYHRHAELLWEALNRWLEHHEGEKGVPTAFALRHRYAGLPMSQALVRRADRARLNRFFASYGLPPHGQMSATDLEPILDDWIGTNPPPVSKFLRDLWQGKGEARERIAGTVSLELSEWDGSTDLPVSDARRSGAVRLVAAVRRFPTRKLALDLSVRIGHEADEATLDIIDATGAVLHKILFTRAADGSLTLAAGQEIDPTTLVAGFVRLRAPSGTAERKPRFVVPLRRDTLLEAYVETDRLQLGESSMLLAPADRKAEVSAALSDCAAPGWEAVNDLHGLPEDWVLFTGVEVYASLDKAKHKWVELDVLVPLGGTQLSLAGGLRLPAKLRKWSTFRPPEIRAVLSDAEVVQVTVEALGEDATWNQTWTSDQGVLLVELGDVGLEDGDYMARLRRSDDKHAVAESLLRLRSADTPNRLPPAPPLGYSTEDAAAFSAEEDGPVRGAAVESEALNAAPAEQGPLPPARLETLSRRRARPRVQIATPSLRLGDVSADSCLNTGAHRIQLPPATGSAKRGWIHGECSGCGLLKRYPATASQARKRTKRGAAARRAPVEVAKLRPVQVKDDVDWQLGLDALCHLGRGVGSALERVALQLEPSKLFADAFTRVLEALAHLDVQRNDRTWRLEAWQVPPPMLVQTTPGQWFLTGWRSEGLVHQLALKSGLRGVDVQLTEEDGAPDAVTLNDAEEERVQEITQLIDYPGQTIAVEARAAERILAAVPPITKVAAAMPRVSRGDVRKVEVWDPDAALWMDEEQPKAGFLRLHGATRTYCMITTQDMKEGKIRPMTPQLLKHVAAAFTKRPLIAWDPDGKTLAVPKGCDLPGLIGRAVTLCSGRPASPTADGEALVYHDIPEHVARAVYLRLGGAL